MPPECTLSEKGKLKIAEYNLYLARLTADTLAANKTGALTVQAARAGAETVNSVVASAAAGAVHDAKAKAAAAWNRTVAAWAG